MRIQLFQEQQQKIELYDQTGPAMSFLRLRKWFGSQARGLAGEGSSRNALLRLQ